MRNAALIFTVPTIPVVGTVMCGVYVSYHGVKSICRKLREHKRNKGSGLTECLTDMDITEDL